MQKFIISVKDKNTGRDVISPYIVNSLDGLGNYSERISPLGLIVIVDYIEELGMSRKRRLFETCQIQGLPTE